jgi:hypothetical protein
MGADESHQRGARGLECGGLVQPVDHVEEHRADVHEHAEHQDDALRACGIHVQGAREDRGDGGEQLRRGKIPTGTATELAEQPDDTELIAEPLPGRPLLHVEGAQVFGIFRLDRHVRDGVDPLPHPREGLLQVPDEPVELQLDERGRHQPDDQDHREPSPRR